jgi:hypothetical protein
MDDEWEPVICIPYSKWMNFLETVDQISQFLKEEKEEIS